MVSYSHVGQTRGLAYDSTSMLHARRETLPRHAISRSGFLYMYRFRIRMVVICSTLYRSCTGEFFACSNLAAVVLGIRTAFYNRYFYLRAATGAGGQYQRY